MQHLPERDRPPIKARMRKAWRGDRLPARARAAHAARGRARAHAPRRRRLAARRDGGDADRDQARDQGQAPAHARVHEPVRVDDRHRPHHPAQRQALVLRRDGAAVDRRRDARSREAVPQGDRLHRATRASRSRSNADSTFPSPTPPRPRRPRSQSLCNDHTGTAVTEVPRRPGQPRGGRSREPAIATVRRVSSSGLLGHFTPWERSATEMRPSASCASSATTLRRRSQPGRPTGRRRRAQSTRARNRPPRRRRADQPADRRGAVPELQERRDPHPEHIRQARRRFTRKGRSDR